MNSSVQNACGARGQAGVDGDDGAAGVARVVGRDECDGGADLLGGGAAAERQRLEQVLPVVSLPVRSRAFFFMSVTRRSVATGPGLIATTRMPSLRADAAERLA